MHHGGGMATKGDDDDALPGCVWCHAREHAAPQGFWSGVLSDTGLTRDDLVQQHRKWYKEETE